MTDTGSNPAAAVICPGYRLPSSRLSSVLGLRGYHGQRSHARGGSSQPSSPLSCSHADMMSTRLQVEVYALGRKNLSARWFAGIHLE